MADSYGFSVTDDDNAGGGNAYFDDFHEDDGVLHEYVQISTYKRAVCQEQFKANVYCVKNNECFAVSNPPSIGSAVVHASTSAFQFDTFNIPVKDCISDGDYFGSTSNIAQGECFVFSGSGVLGQNVESATFTITEQCSDEAVMIPTQSYIAPNGALEVDEAATTTPFAAFMFVCLILGLVGIAHSKISKGKSVRYQHIVEKTKTPKESNADEEEGQDEEVHVQFVDMPRTPHDVIASNFPNSYQAISTDI